MARGEISWWRSAKAARAVLPLMLEEENALGYLSARRRRRSSCDSVVETATSDQTQASLNSAGIVGINHIGRQECKGARLRTAFLAPHTCRQPKRKLLTFGIVGVREVAAILRTCYKCTPESTAHFPILQSW